MSRDWKPGDVALVDGRWRSGRREERPAICRPTGWVSVSDAAFIKNGDAISARPLLVLDPEDDGRVRAIRDAMVIAIVDHTDARDRMLSNDEFDTVIARALQTLIAEPETPPEPTDPAVRVVGSDGGEWARVGNIWVRPYKAGRNWEALQDYAPLTIVTPEDRPLRVGDRVEAHNGDHARITWLATLSSAVEVKPLDGGAAYCTDVRTLTRLPEEATR